MITGHFSLESIFFIQRTDFLCQAREYRYEDTACIVIYSYRVREYRREGHACIVIYNNGVLEYHRDDLACITIYRDRALIPPINTGVYSYLQLA